MCGSAWFPAGTLEAGNLAGELDTVQALGEVLRVHPEIKTLVAEEILTFDRGGFLKQLLWGEILIHLKNT